MVRNIVVIGGSSHPKLNEQICGRLGIPLGDALLTKFSVGETRVEIRESVRGKDVYIIQSGGGKVNDHLMELLVIISACKTSSAKKVTAVLPLFPYSRQSDIPYHKAGAPLVKSSASGGRVGSEQYTFESTPPTPHPDKQGTRGLPNGIDGLQKSLSRVTVEDYEATPTPRTPRVSPYTNGITSHPKRSDTDESSKSTDDPRIRPLSVSFSNSVNEDTSSTSSGSQKGTFQPNPGYKQWVAQAGTLVANLLTAAGADHIITMDLHDPQYQGFFDIPVDNLYGRTLLKNYIQEKIPDLRQTVIVSPDAGGAKRATAIADQLGTEFALIHKERRPTKITDRQNATMMLVGAVKGKIAVLIDDLADTSNTITRAAKLLKKEGASRVWALVTHGVLSGDAIERINASDLDRVVVTNSIDQREHQAKCEKLEVLEIGQIFAEAIRRVHYGESISSLFHYD